MYFYKSFIRFIFVVLICFNPAVTATARIFNLMNGDQIEGMVQDYDMRSDRVTFNSASGRTTVKADDLDNDSYRYVREWDALKKFSNPDNFRITLYDPEKLNTWEKFIWLRNPGKVEPYKTHEISLTRIGHDLKMINETGHDLENVRIKYCLFYNQDRMDHFKEEKVTDIIVRPCIDEITIFPNELTDRRTLKSIVLRDVEIMYTRTSGGGGWVEVKEYLEGDGVSLRSDFIGAIVRVEMESLDGNIIMHEKRYPKDLSEDYAWIEPSENNTYWEDDNISEVTDIYKPPTPFEEMGGVEEEEEE